MAEQDHLIYVRAVGGGRVPDPGGGVRAVVPPEGMWVDRRTQFFQRRIMHGELEEAKPPKRSERPGANETEPDPRLLGAPAEEKHGGV